MKRRWLIPETIQTSAMDCGPAALKALMGGFGLRASYGRLREACHTDVDGTSIDTIEEIAVRLGLDASQVMVPLDHLLLPDANVLPCMVVVQLEGSGNHFVVAWRKHGPWLQVMDPAAGRRWVRASRFLEEVYLHEQKLPAIAWLEWARSPGLLDPLRARMRQAGVSRSRSEELIRAAIGADGWRSLAALDAAVHLATSLRSSSLVDWSRNRS